MKTLKFWSGSGLNYDVLDQMNARISVEKTGRREELYTVKWYMEYSVSAQCVESSLRFAAYLF